MAAFIFDMDGTMVDNMMVHHRAWQIKLAELGLEMELEAVRQTIHGKNEEILAKLFGDRFTPEEFKRISWEKENAYRRQFISSLKLIDGLPVVYPVSTSVRLHTCPVHLQEHQYTPGRAPDSTIFFLQLYALI